MTISKYVFNTFRLIKSYAQKLIVCQIVMFILLTVFSPRDIIIEQKLRKESAVARIEE